jgi:hypothetical protein
MPPGMAACFFLGPYSKMWQGKHKLKGEILCTEESVPDEIGNSQSIQIAKKAKICWLTVKEASSGRKAKNMTR